MKAAAGIPVAAADTRAILDSTCLDSTDNTVWAVAAGEDCVRDVLRDVLREYVLAPVPYRVDQKYPAESSDEWATYCQIVHL